MYSPEISRRNERRVKQALGSSCVGSPAGMHHLGSLQFEDVLLAVRSDVRAGRTGNVCIEVADLARDWVRDRAWEPVGELGDLTPVRAVLTGVLKTTWLSARLGRPMAYVHLVPDAGVEHDDLTDEHFSSGWVYETGDMVRRVFPWPTEGRWRTWAADGDRMATTGVLLSFEEMTGPATVRFEGLDALRDAVVEVTRGKPMTEDELLARLPRPADFPKGWNHHTRKVRVQGPVGIAGFKDGPDGGAIPGLTSLASGAPRPLPPTL